MADRCTDYAQMVVDGKSPRRVGKLEILACKRHLEDLKRQNTPDFPYYYDEAKAKEVIDFAEKLIIAEGDEPKPVKLHGFQDFIFGSLYGWRNSKGFRRFRLSYIEMARQNGKSFCNGINASYIGNFSGYNYGQLYLVATKQDQAKIVFDEIVKFINSDEDLGELFVVKDYKSEIECKLTNSKIRALSRDTKKIDGFRPLFGSVDEYHAHESNQMYKLLEGGTGNLDETLISIITTAGFNLNSPCFEMRGVAEQILRRSFYKETQFVAIYTMDKDDDIWEPLNWQKANPLTCIDDDGIDRMRDIAETAKLAGGHELRDFMTKRLNVWVQNADNQYIDVEKFLACGSDRKLDYFAGRECYAGLDLSSGGDLTTLALEIPFVEDGRQKYYLWSHSFMPRARLQEHIKSDLAPYDCWQSEKLITVTGGMGDYKNDYLFIVKTLEELIEKYNLKLKAIGYDSHNADGFLSSLDIFGCPLVEIKQSARFLNDATSDLQLLIKQGDVEYDKSNGLFIWSFVNAQVVANSFGEIKVDKEQGKRNKRIDPVDAAIDAHLIAMKPTVQIDLDSSIGKFMDLMG
jgi:phage terminase large subunit-like protein